MSDTLTVIVPHQDLAGVSAAATEASDPLSTRVSETADALAEILRTGEFADRWSAAAVLGRMSAAAVERLVDALDDGDADVRWLAAFALSHHGSRAERAVGPLINALDDEDAYVRWAAAEALGAVASEAPNAIEEAAEPLAECLLDEDHEVVHSAAGALRNLKAHSSSALPILDECLGHPDNWVRWSALSILETLGPAARDTAGAVARCLTDSDPAVRRRALLALEAIGEPASEEISRLLRDAEPSLRRAAAASLGCIGRHGATIPVVPRLVEALDDRSAATRAVVAQALGKIGRAAAEAAPRLGELVQDSRESVRHAAVNSLGRIGVATENVIESLVGALENVDGGAVDQGLRAPAANALGNLGLDSPVAIASLRRCVTDASADVRAASVRALGEIDPNNAESLDVLVTSSTRLADEEEEVREAALEAVVKFVSRAREVDRADDLLQVIDAIESRCDAHEETTRIAAARVLARIAPQRARQSRRPECRLAFCRDACEHGLLEDLERGLESAEISRDALDELLAHACRHGSIDCARRLVELGADVNARDERDRTPLMLACESDGDRHQIIAFLASEGADVDARDADGATALIEAVSRGRTENVDALLRLDANSDLATAKHETALSFAIVWDRPELVKRLLRSRADPNLETPDGNTPLAHALGLRLNRRIVRLLLQYDADPDRGTIAGTSFPVHALRLEDESLAIEFLTRSRNLDSRDSYGHTMLEFARQKRMTKVVKVLESLGSTR